MDERQRSQISLLLSDILDLSCKSVRDGLQALLADHSASGRLQSAATIKVAIRLFEETAGTFVDKATDAVAAVAKDVEAFAKIESCLATFDAYLMGELDVVVSMATGGKGKTSMASVDDAARNEFNDARSRWSRKLEIQRFAFTLPSTAAPMTRSLPAINNPVPKNAGGKPLAAHWDQMWSHIAVALWLGELEPKRQADITKAMNDWLASKGVDASETAVVERSAPSGMQSKHRAS